MQRVRTTNGWTMLPTLIVSRKQNQYFKQDLAVCCYFGLKVKKDSSELWEEHWWRGLKVQVSVASPGAWTLGTPERTGVLRR